LGIEAGVKMSQCQARKPELITLKLSGLIQKVLKATQIGDCNAKATPAGEK